MGGIIVGSCREAPKVTTKDVLVSKIANDLTTTIHRNNEVSNTDCQSMGSKKHDMWRCCWSLKIHLLFSSSRKMVSLPCILPRKHCCKQVAATNFQPPRDRRHLSYCHCENLQGMLFAKFLAHVHHSGANIALWPRSPPSLQWQVHGSTSES